MTAQNRTTLKTYFNSGDKPTEAQFANLIDSYVSLTDSALQTVASDVVFSGNITASAKMTATNASITAVLSAVSIAGLTTPLSVGQGGSGVAASDPVIQRVSTSTNAVATGTTQLPFDDTVPQNTEGDQYLSLAITPKNAANILVIEALVNLSNNGVANFALSAALFQDATANALAGSATTGSVSTGIYQAYVKFIMAAGTTSATTFKVRAGANVAGTTTLNGQSGARRFGGTMLSYLTITEYAA